MNIRYVILCVEYCDMDLTSYFRLSENFPNNWFQSGFSGISSNVGVHTIDSIEVIIQMLYCGSFLP
jgi:hypothetical protein